MIVLRKSFPLLSLLALTLLVSACSAGAIQKDALCQRSSRLDIANSNVGNMPQAFGSYTGLSLKSQLLDDLEALTVAQEVGPTSLENDFAYLIRVNQSLFEVMTDLSWDTSIAATNQSIDESLIEFASITIPFSLSISSSIVFRDFLKFSISSCVLTFSSSRFCNSKFNRCILERFSIFFSLNGETLSVSVLIKLSN